MSSQGLATNRRAYANQEKPGSIRVEASIQTGTRWRFHKDDLAPHGRVSHQIAFWSPSINLIFDYARCCHSSLYSKGSTEVIATIRVHRKFHFFWNEGKTTTSDM
jgi:hypothetical protein